MENEMTSWLCMGVHGVRRLVRGSGTLLTFAVVALLATACGDDRAVDAEIAQVTESCTLNSDCAEDLICVFERCHEACDSTDDCDYPARCVQSPKSNVHVCLFPDESKCGDEADRECDAPLVCAADDLCRGPCERDGDCPLDQRCSSDGACADEKELNESGELRDAQEREADGGPTGGSDDDPSSDDSDEEGDTDDAKETVDAGENETEVEPSQGANDRPNGAGVDGGSEPSGPEPSSDDEVDEGMQSDAGGMGDPGSPTTDDAPSPTPEPNMSPDVDYYEADDGLEPVPNGEREQAQPLTTASIWLTSSDTDWFYVDVPDDGKAHIIVFKQVESASVVSRARAIAAADTSAMGDVYTARGGETRTFYLSVGSGTRTLFEIRSTNNSKGRSELSVEILDEDDVYEPNQTRDTAAPIPLNTDISARMLVPYVSQTDAVASDYYEVDLEQGQALLRLVDVPEGSKYRMTLRPLGEGSSVTIGNSTAGDTGSWSFNVASTGKYAIEIVDPSAVAFSQSRLPAMFEDYVFRVEQGAASP